MANEKNIKWVRATPAARKLAAERNMSLWNIPISDRGYINKKDIETYVAMENTTHNLESEQCKFKTTPSARKIAMTAGINIQDVQPSNGTRIYRKDVEAFISAGRANQNIMPKESRREPFKGMRKVIGERMTKSYFLYPAVTITSTADMKALQDYRSRFNSKHINEGIKATVTDMIVLAVARALRENEIINASIDGDEIVYHEDINVGIAVSKDSGGLLVPVLRRADKLSLKKLCTLTKELVSSAREGSINGDALVGGTFTISNMGTKCVDTFTPIINYPESAILGVGRTVDKVTVVNGMITIRPIAALSLTHDHRLIDGVPAADFLAAVIKYIENPNLLFEE